MKISKEWTKDEREWLIERCQAQMLDLADRIRFLSYESARFLENNREHILSDGVLPPKESSERTE